MATLVVFVVTETKRKNYTEKFVGVFQEKLSLDVDAGNCMDVFLTFLIVFSRQQQVE